MSEDKAAYAKLDGRCDSKSFSAYITKPLTDIGRSLAPTENSTSADRIELTQSKALSRRHAQIRWNGELDRFDFEVLGKNGATVNDVHYQRGAVVALCNGTPIRMGPVRVYFLLPLYHKPAVTYAELVMQAFRASEHQSRVNSEGLTPKDVCSWIITTYQFYDAPENRKSGTFTRAISKSLGCHPDLIRVDDQATGRVTNPPYRLRRPEDGPATGVGMKRERGEETTVSTSIARGSKAVAAPATKKANAGPLRSVAPAISPPHPPTVPPSATTSDVASSATVTGSQEGSGANPSTIQKQ